MSCPTPTDYALMWRDYDGRVKLSLQLTKFIWIGASVTLFVKDPDFEEEAVEHAWMQGYYPDHVFDYRSWVPGTTFRCMVRALCRDCGYALALYTDPAVVP